MREPRNWYEAMRGMQIRADQELPGRNLSSLPRILQLDLTGPDILERLEKFDSIIEHSADQNHTLVGDELKLAVSLRAVPEEIRVCI